MLWKIPNAKDAVQLFSFSMCWELPSSPENWEPTALCWKMLWATRWNDADCWHHFLLRASPRDGAAHCACRLGAGLLPVLPSCFHCADGTWWNAIQSMLACRAVEHIIFFWNTIQGCCIFQLKVELVKNLALPLILVLSVETLKEAVGFWAKDIGSALRLCVTLAALDVYFCPLHPI